MGNFEVVTYDDNEEEIKFYKRLKNMALWCNQHRSVVEKAFKDYKTLAEMPQDILSRLVFCGIRYALSVEDYINAAKDMDGVADARVWFEYLNVIFKAMGYMTVRIKIPMHHSLSPVQIKIHPVPHLVQKLIQSTVIQKQTVILRIN